MSGAVAKKKKQTGKPVANKPTSRCPKCGSMKRSRYFGSRRVIPLSGYECNRCRLIYGSAAGGQCSCGGTFEHHFTKVVWRNTQCGECGQARVDRSFE